MNYYEHHLGDYLRDTAHLSMLEDAAYRRLLDRIYATEQGIPADQAHRIVRARTEEERAAVDAVLGEFFTLVDGCYVQQRAMAEIEKAKRKIEASRSNGRSGGRPRKNPIATPEETQEKPSGFPSGSQNETQSKALQTPDSKHQTPEEEGSLRAPSSARALREDFLDFLMATYPQTSHAQAWIPALKYAQRAVSVGEATEEDLRRRIVGFRAFVDSGGLSGPDKVPTPQAWLHPTAEPRRWAREWAAVPTREQRRQDAIVDAGIAFLNRPRVAS